MKEICSLLENCRVEAGEDTTNHKPVRWIHAEGRNCDALFWFFHGLPPGTWKLSVDFEKPGRPGLRELFPFVDVAFISKIYATYIAAENIRKDRPLTDEGLVRALLKTIGGVLKTNALGYVMIGSGGCYLFWNRDYYDVFREGDIESGYWQDHWFFIHLPAPELPGAIVETTGAGDAFIAGALACRTLWERGSVSGIVEAGVLGNLVAGRKCRRRGYNNLWGSSPLERSLGIVATDL